MRCLKSILLFFFIASQVESVGQVFPVQSTVQLTPPYSLYLSDYAAPGSERLRVTAFLIDATRPELNVRFRLRIEGNGIKIETKPEFLPPPVALLGGVPLQLVSSDLAAYFDPRNLNFTGITQREIEQRGALPEGLYQFCFEVIEYNRGVKISNTGCAVAWLILNDPPIVNLPRDNEKIRIQDPQQVVFQWTPRHRGSPNSAFNAEYDFKLVEVWPSTRNPNDAILTSPVIFQTTTSETTLIYGPAETPLEPGRRYAFQIRARAYAGADEVSLFKNNGFSQVYTFVYGDACLAPQNISASDIGTTRFSVNFEGAPNHSSYSLRYRPIPNPQVPTPNAQSPSPNWYSATSLTPNLTINSLQPNTRYEFQVNAGCGTFTSDYSLLTSVTTKDNPGIQYSCGVPLTPFNLDPSQLINSLRIGDVIKAGDFDVILSKVSGSNGTFSGEGVIEVSYFNRAKVKAEFTNINVSNEMRMVNGYMNVTGAGVEVVPAGLMDLMDDLDEALAKADELLGNRNTDQFDENATVTSTLITVPGPATISQGVNGSVVIVDASGKRTELPKGTTASVVDGTGKGYIIDSKGKVHSTTAAVATQAANREYNLKLKFAAFAEQKFGFDEKRYDQIASTYTKIENQYLSWKSVATGQTDKALAIVEGAGIDKSKIRYELGGLELRPQDLGTQSPSPNAQVLELRGTADGLEEELIALYDPPSPNSQPPSPNSQVPSSKTQVLGKLSVITYDQLVKDLVIVPVNGNKYPYDEDALRTQLNKIYGQAVVKWNITFAQNFDVPGIDPFDDGGSGLLSNYSPDMRKVVNAYKANLPTGQAGLQPNTYYLFLVKNPKSTTLAGFMPRSKSVGFIFLDKNGSEEELARTIAHELGHGAFQLRHTFADERNTLPKGTTTNLMDYVPAGQAGADGTKLYKYQWDRVRYREIVIGLFEDDEEGAMVAAGSERFPDAATPCTTAQVTKLQQDFEARLAGKKFKIYGGGMEMYGLFGDKLEKGHLEILAKAGICDLAQFDAKFKYVLNDPSHDIVRDVDIIYSTVNLWEGLQAGYNDGSVDWESFVVPKITNQAELDNELNRLEAITALAKQVLPSGVVSETSYNNIADYIKTCREQPALALESKIHLNQTIKGIYVGLHCYANYTYSFSDLKVRLAIKASRTMWPDVGKAEQEGFAIPLSVSNNYTQYLAQYNTDKAYFLGEQYLEMVFLNQMLKGMKDMFANLGTAWRTAINKQARLKMQQRRTDLDALKGQVSRIATAQQTKLNLGRYVEKIGDYEVYENGEVFYRTMSKQHYETLLSTKKLSPTSETFTSPTQSYSEAYRGHLVKISVKAGTIEKLKSVGTSDGSADVIKKFGEMPRNSQGWTNSKSYFKKEGAQVNIGLGKGKALEIFNENISGFELVKVIE